MSDDSSGGLGPRPTPTTQEPELFPGGTDAVRDESDYADRGAQVVGRDADPDDNPATEDATPDEVKEGEDKQQEPDDDERGEDAGSDAEPPA
ncbi:hypothetical protein GCM10009737_23100 [Nocardioides lentus]|uniref:Uncharacterized protein n=1 Tax=Nocardioides lentus TaxID=338077 RepID=A0ABN2PGB4_9ACTN